MENNINVALITGITGQDGSYLSELLLDKKYIVWGIIRRCSNFNTKRIDHLLENENLILRHGDMTDGILLSNILYEITNTYPNINRLEIYNLAAMSHVKVSFEIPEYTTNVDGMGVLRLLEIIRTSPILDRIRFYQASTSELYGKVQEIPQNENTPFYPRSPYGIAKLYGFWMVKHYRETYNLFACNGILYNHESPRRGSTFITKKITEGINRILKKELPYLTLGNINAKRDWGHAKDYVEGMWRMLQIENPDDYILATNECHSVREFIEQAFKIKNIIIKWKGSGINELGYNEETGETLIKISEKYFRPAEVDELLGDYSKAKRDLGWEPKYSFNELVSEMVEHDYK